MTDVIERVRRYAPTTASVAAEWTIANDDELLARITGGSGIEAEIVPLHFVPARATRRRSWGRMLPVAASAAALAVAAGGLIALLPGAGGGAGAPGARLSGPVFDPPAGLSGQPEVGPREFAHQLTEQIELDAQGRPVPNADFAMVRRDYVAPDGRVVSHRSGQQTGCFAFDGPDRPSVDDPTRALLASLPTTVGRLTRYLHSHVDGSSSRDQAVFVTVGDALRDDGLLASPRLRAAMVAVLSRTSGVTLHRDQSDYLGRPALRLDFVDQRLEPGAVESLYFDQATYRLLETRSGASGESSKYAGPSPAYGNHAPTGRDPEHLSYPASITLIRSATVVNHAPAGCH